MDEASMRCSTKQQRGRKTSYLSSCCETTKAEGRGRGGEGQASVGRSEAAAAAAAADTQLFLPGSWSGLFQGGSVAACIDFNVLGCSFS